MIKNNTYQIKGLIKKNRSDCDLIFKSKSGPLKIDLKPEHISLWIPTLKKQVEPCNLLIACERNNCDFSATKLTWVVGAAIRPVFVDNPDETFGILRSLGIKEELIKLALKHCPGLGDDVPWALYLERHGYLTASPISDQFI